jgi:hypothetical protein
MWFSEAGGGQWEGSPDAGYADPMGGATVLRQHNGPHKVFAGWIPQGQIVSLGSTPGFYTASIAPLETDPASALAPQIVQIDWIFDILLPPKPLTLSYRYPIGFDGHPTVTNLTGDANFLEKCNVHEGAGLTEYSADPADCETAQSPDGIITISQISHDPDKTDVMVTIGPTRLFTISPAMHMSQPVLGPDIRHKFTLTLTNRDHDPCNDFPRDDFDLTGSTHAYFDYNFPHGPLRVDQNDDVADTDMHLNFSSLPPDGLYEFTIQATDTGDPFRVEEVPASYLVDGTAPSAPSGLVATSDCERHTLFWTPSTDFGSGISEYEIFRDGIRIASTALTTYEDVATTATHTYQVRAIDAVGNESGFSGPRSVTVPVPAVPANLTADASCTQILLQWTAVECAAEYEIYRDGALIETTSSAYHVDNNVAKSTTYTYWIRSLDALGQSSDPSQTATETTPARSECGGNGKKPPKLP